MILKEESMRDLIEWLENTQSKPYDLPKPNIKDRSRLAMLNRRLAKAQTLHWQELDKGNLEKAAQAVYIIRTIGDELSGLTVFRTV